MKKDEIPDDIEEVLIERKRTRPAIDPEPRWSPWLARVGWLLAAAVLAMVLGLEVKWHREAAAAPVISVSD